ncbi:restriction endonuclease [Zhihengliuella salsuginis]|uniref:Restriction endonuclease n=1 Tax=Zhihengliuella salsuginis TaxID=578222 RepID=A0ABQ3GJ94_9MICC|nr:restriction endonuclease [Zhihengliuella salsuginis]GHD07543.1 restriction endonuclease [Zhihengliuella salsuginis]
MGHDHSELESEVPIWPHMVRSVLAVLYDGRTIARRDLVAGVIEELNLSPAAKAETLNTGGSRAEQRIGWAISNLAKAGWIERPERAMYRVTEQGRAWHDANPDGIESFGEARLLFREFWPKKGTADDKPDTVVADELVATDPVEQIESAIDRIHGEVGEQLLNRLRESHPDFFEEAVVKLLLGMGYGGAEQRGMRIGGTGDGGVDGLIDQDPLGLDRLYVQAKRYGDGNTVGREQIQAFIGALHGFGAAKGVFITTSAFTRHAREYAGAIPTRVILIDGQRLVSLMIKYRVGVQTKRTYHVVDIDEDFFE